MCCCERSILARLGVVTAAYFPMKILKPPQKAAIRNHRQLSWAETADVSVDRTFTIVVCLFWKSTGLMIRRRKRLRIRYRKRIEQPGSPGPLRLIQSSIKIQLPLYTY